MTRFAKYIVSFAAILVVSCAALPALALDPGDINITVKSEVAIPGHLLEPGTYWFRRATGDETGFYKVETADGEFIGFVDVIPALRNPKADNNTEVEISSPDAAGVRVLQAWFTGGDNRGYELLYPKNGMQKLDQIAEMRAHSSGAAGQH